MTITQNVDPNIYNYLSDDLIQQVVDYIDSPMTATTLPKEKTTSGHREGITSELIYYWMFSWNIPMECQKWHINRLITLIRIFSIKNSKPKKRSQRELMNSNWARNMARRKKHGTKG